jgi:hypothetical protein
VFSVANKLALVRARRGLILLALVALSALAGKLGHPPVVGMWDGPL